MHSLRSDPSRARKLKACGASISDVSAHPWAKPVQQFVLIVGVIACLAWFGARTASSEPSMQPSTVVSSRAGDSGLDDDRVVGLRLPTADAAVPVGDVRDAGVMHAKPRGVLADGRVVLNAANETELQALPRVGPTRSRKILELRQKLGRFRSVRDLLRVKGIGTKTLLTMRDKVVLDDPEREDEAAKP